MAVQWTAPTGSITGPSWSEMVSQAATILGYKDPELLRMRGTDLQILEYFRIKKNNFAPLTNWMVRLMDAPDDAIRASKIHASLCQLTRCEIFYTTNYDDFLERALRGSGREVRVIATEGDMGFYGSAAQVVKFHGDFNNPDEMVLSEAQYYRRMKLAPIIRESRRLAMRAHDINRVDGGGCSGTFATRWSLKLRGERGTCRIVHGARAAIEVASAVKA